MKKKEKLKPINLGSVRLTRQGGTIDLEPSNPMPENYIYCAGIYCVCCFTYWNENWKKWVQHCDHFTLTGVSSK